MIGGTERYPEEAGSMEKPPQEGLEIERKFLVRGMPDELAGSEGVLITQGYLYIDEESGDEIRVRQKGGKYYRTEKKGRGLMRSETEVEISEELFRDLFSQTQGARVTKTRHLVRHGDYTIEVDFFHDGLSGLVTAEVEFDDGDDSGKFVAPWWLGKELTGNNLFSNQNLARVSDIGELEDGLGEEDEWHIREYGLETGIVELKTTISGIMPHLNRPVIVLVAGGSASGKTSAVALRLANEFNGLARVVSMDDYSRGNSFVEDQLSCGVELNWDMPGYVDIDRAATDVKNWKGGMEVIKPIFDFSTGEKSGKSETVPGCDVMIVEGLFALDERLVEEADAAVFVDIGMHGRMLRRLFRDVDRTGQVPNDILKYFAEVVEPMHEKYVLSSKHRADIIIRNEFDANTESVNAGGVERQLKFSADLTDETLRRVGAERISASYQVDNYYQPKDRDLGATGEVLRLRQENNMSILTYKGPMVNEVEVRKRHTFSGEIDDVTAMKLLRLYGECRMTIVKNRRVYRLGTMIVTVDTDVVRSRQGGASEELGNFAEVRFTGDEISEQERALLLELNLDMNYATMSSYQNMLVTEAKRV